MQRMLNISFVVVCVILGVTYINATKNQTTYHTTKKPSHDGAKKSSSDHVVKNDTHESVTKSDHGSKNLTDSHGSKNKSIDHGAKNKTAPMTGEELAKKVAELKHQAVKLMKLEGRDVPKNQTPAKPSDLWGDIKITEDVYHKLKKNFDEEQQRLEHGSVDRATAPDFDMVPDAKWISMPIKYTTINVQSKDLKDAIKAAVKDIEDASGCISFEEVTVSPSVNFIQYEESKTLPVGTCGFALYGRRANNEKNVVEISERCPTKGNVIHETLHALAFAHTQQRPDADDFVTINWKNLPEDEDTVSNFKTWPYALKGVGTFDFGSILMYSPTAFGGGAETITPKDDPDGTKKAEMGQRDGLSSEDKKILKQIYCKS